MWFLHCNKTWLFECFFLLSRHELLFLERFLLCFNIFIFSSNCEFSVSLPPLLLWLLSLLLLLLLFLSLLLLSLFLHFLFFEVSLFYFLSLYFIVLIEYFKILIIWCSRTYYINVFDRNNFCLFIFLTVFFIYFSEVALLYSYRYL